MNCSNNVTKWLWPVVALAVLVMAFWLGRLSVDSRLERAATGPFVPVATGSSVPVELPQRIREILPDGYNGPMIEFHFRDTKGMLLTLEQVNIQPIVSHKAHGGTWILNDGKTGPSQGLRTAFV